MNFRDRGQSSLPKLKSIYPRFRPFGPTGAGKRLSYDSLRADGRGLTEDGTPARQRGLQEDWLTAGSRRAPIYEPCGFQNSPAFRFGREASQQFARAVGFALSCC